MLICPAMRITKPHQCRPTIRTEICQICPISNQTASLAECMELAPWSRYSWGMALADVPPSSSGTFGYLLPRSHAAFAVAIRRIAPIPPDTPPLRRVATAQAPNAARRAPHGGPRGRKSTPTQKWQYRIATSTRSARLAYRCARCGWRLCDQALSPRPRSGPGGACSSGPMQRRSSIDTLLLARSVLAFPMGSSPHLLLWEICASGWHTQPLRGATARATRIRQRASAPVARCYPHVLAVPPTRWSRFGPLPPTQLVGPDGGPCSQPRPVVPSLDTVT